MTYSITTGFLDIGPLVELYNRPSLDAQAQSSLAAGVRDTFGYILPVEAGWAVRGFDSAYDRAYAAMTAASETLQQNNVTAGSVSFSGTGNDGAGSIRGNPTTTAGIVDPTQMLLDGDVFELACLRASIGNDTWSVKSQQRNKTQYAYTGTDFPSGDDLLGIAFRILEPVSVVTGDTGSTLSDTDNILGGVVGTNSDTSGKVYVAISSSGATSGTTHTLGAWTSENYCTLGGTTGKVLSASYASSGTPKSVTLTAENSSGLSGSVTVNNALTAATITVDLAVAYEVGDKFTVAACSVTEDGTYQTFFRDAFGKVFPSSTVPTVLDSWAE